MNTKRIFKDEHIITLRFGARIATKEYCGNYDQITIFDKDGKKIYEVMLYKTVSVKK